MHSNFLESALGYLSCLHFFMLTNIFIYTCLSTIYITSLKQIMSNRITGLNVSAFKKLSVYFVKEQKNYYEFCSTFSPMLQVFCCGAVLIGYEVVILHCIQFYILLLWLNRNIIMYESINRYIIIFRYKHSLLKHLSIIGI